MKHIAIGLHCVVLHFEALRVSLEKMSWRRSWTTISRMCCALRGFDQDMWWYLCVLCNHYLHQQQQLLQDRFMSFIIISMFTISRSSLSSWSWSAWIICNLHGPRGSIIMIFIVLLIAKNILGTCVIGPPCISREARLVGGPGSPVHSGNDHINYCVLSFLIILDNNWFCWLTIFLKLDNDLSSRIMINNPWW